MDLKEWFDNFYASGEYLKFKERPIVYFCTEYALRDNIPTFAGGLGVLAGDFLREAFDRKFPVIAVGLYYHEGYTCQMLDEHGNIVEACPIVSPDSAGLTPLVNEKNEKITVSIPLQDRTVTVQAWVFNTSTASLYLLDTNVEQNDPRDRLITNKLYAIDKETRFKQEMVLGIGGVRLIEAMNIHPSVYHLNEGHSAMLILDLARHEMKVRKIGFTEAVALAKRHIVFTNHTLVAAGNEIYSNDLASVLLGSYADELQVPVGEVISLGLVQESTIFSMTMLSLRTAGKINAVSRLHQKKAAQVWTDHSMEAVTNGIHIPTWDRVGAADLTQSHLANKQKLLERIKEETGQSWSEQELLIGWARRVVAYKRPLALFEDINRFALLAKNTNRPVKVVLAGFAPPGDDKGSEILIQLTKLIRDGLSGVGVYLSKYDMELAALMSSGTDVWLNTPVVGFEACGTSGMKAALNGSLPVSTKDGWVDEIELFKVGWILESDNVSKNLLDIFENDVIPLYYSSKEEWQIHMKNGREMVLNQFSATRMLKEYIEKLYIPTLSELNH